MATGFLYGHMCALLKFRCMNVCLHGIESKDSQWLSVLTCGCWPECVQDPLRFHVNEPMMTNSQCHFQEVVAFGH